MKTFKLEEITKSTQQFDYELRSNLTLVLILVKPMDASIRVRVRLLSKGASVTVIGLVMGRGDHHISIHTEQIHEAPETTSNLLVKAVLFDKSEFAYDGIIRIEKNAQKSDAYQKNENLLLSGDAHVRSDPALEILANDVRCTHGSTTGKPSEDQMWYLLSRGLTKKLALKLFVDGFFEHAIMGISDTIAQERIRKML